MTRNTVYRGGAWATGREGREGRLPMAEGRQGSWEAAETLCGGGASVNLRPFLLVKGE